MMVGSILMSIRSRILVGPALVLGNVGISSGIFSLCEVLYDAAVKVETWVLLGAVDVEVVAGLQNLL